MTQQEWMVIAGALYVALEYWLGKTNKVKAGSAVEAVLNGLKAVIFKNKD